VVYRIRRERTLSSSFPNNEMAVIETTARFLFCPEAEWKPAKPLSSLARELVEEIGWELISPTATPIRAVSLVAILPKAFQKKWVRSIWPSSGDSRCAAHPITAALDGNADRERKLTQEFQRWACARDFALSYLSEH